MKWGRGSRAGKYLKERPAGSVCDHCEYTSGIRRVELYDAVRYLCMECRKRILEWI